MLEVCCPNPLTAASPVQSSPGVALGVVLAVSPALIKLMAFFMSFDLTTPVKILSAMILSTLPWRHLYQSSPRAFEQQLSMCFRVPFLLNRRHAGTTTKPQQGRLEGLGNASLTAWIKNLMRCGSDRQRSAHEFSFFAACSNFVQTHCISPPRSRPSPCPELVFSSLSPEPCQN